MRPDARALFQLDDVDPRSHGRMLSEILCLLLDSAKGEDYVRPTLRTIAADHVSYGIRNADLYSAFLDALIQVIGTLLDDDETTARARAWKRQRDALLAALP